MIKVSGIHKSFGNKHLLQGITFSLDAGEKVSLLGPGGCGKSTVLKIILGLMQPDEGFVEVEGVNFQQAEDSAKREILRKVGMAFQQGALFDFMTVRENLLFAMEHMTKLTKHEMEERVHKLLQAVKLAKAENLYPFELSGGMQRRVGIARALSTDPTMAFFDEPTSGLDPVTSTIILNMIMELAGHDGDRCQLVATSNVEIAIRFADRILLLNEGKLVADGNWRDLILTGSEWVKKFLSVRLIGLDEDYARELKLPQKFIDAHW